MKIFKKVFRVVCLALISLGFSQCASTKKLEKKAPIQFGEVYTTSWVAGVKGGGSGLNLFIETLTKDLKLDSVYFRGKKAKLEVKPANPKLFIGRFLSKDNMSKSFDEEMEIGKAEKEIKESTSKFPFQLEDNECVISYVLDNKMRYYKLTNIAKKEPEALPMSARPNKN